MRDLTSETEGSETGHTHSHMAGRRQGFIQGVGFVSSRRTEIQPARDSDSCSDSYCASTRLRYHGGRPAPKAVQFLLCNTKALTPKTGGGLARPRARRRLARFLRAYALRGVLSVGKAGVLGKFVTRTCDDCKFLCMLQSTQRLKLFL